jgi:hypothetical protein
LTFFQLASGSVHNEVTVPTSSFGAASIELTRRIVTQIATDPLVELESTQMDIAAPIAGKTNTASTHHNHIDAAQSLALIGGSISSRPNRAALTRHSPYYHDETGTVREKTTHQIRNNGGSSKVTVVSTSLPAAPQLRRTKSDTVINTRVSAWGDIPIRGLFGPTNCTSTAPEVNYSTFSNRDASSSAVSAHIHYESSQRKADVSQPPQISMEQNDKQLSEASIGTRTVMASQGEALELAHGHGTSAGEHEQYKINPDRQTATSTGYQNHPSSSSHAGHHGHVAVAPEHPAPSPIHAGFPAIPHPFPDTFLIPQPPPSEYNGKPLVCITPHPHDVLSGRGAFVNAHSGNRHFRTLSWARKPAFDAGNHILKRQLAMEVVHSVLDDLDPPGRFLQKVVIGKGIDKTIGWVDMGTEKAINKACQVRVQYGRVECNHNNIDGQSQTVACALRTTQRRHPYPNPRLVVISLYA